MATAVAVDALGGEWKGYVVQISGGNDKQGFPMKQGVLTHRLVHLLLSKGHSCYRPRRTKERKCNLFRVALWMPICAPHLDIVKKGRKILRVSLVLLCLVAWGPKELAESTNFIISLKKMMSANML